MATEPVSVLERARLRRERAPVNTVFTVLALIALAVAAVLVWASVTPRRAGPEAHSAERGSTGTAR